MWVRICHKGAREKTTEEEIKHGKERKASMSSPE